MEQQDHDGDNDDDGDDDLFENSSFHKIVKMPQQWSSLPKKIHLLFSLQVNATTEPLHILPLDSADPVSCPGPGHVPHLHPGKMCGVQLEDRGVVVSVASTYKQP